MPVHTEQDDRNEPCNQENLICNATVSAYGVPRRAGDEIPATGRQTTPEAPTDVNMKMKIKKRVQNRVAQRTYRESHIKMF